jgi:WD40 repeat protein
VDGLFVIGDGGRVGIGIRWPGSDSAPRAGTLIRFDVQTGATQALAAHGNDLISLEIDPSGNVIATASGDGTIRVGRVTGEEPHLLLGQEGRTGALAFSPDGRWLAAAGEAFSMRVWPVPGMTRTPAHMRSHDEFLAFLRSHTNLRAVPDGVLPGGYRLEAGPFAGWRTPPEW